MWSNIFTEGNGLDFKANSGIWGTMFGVPCIVADNFLKLATGEQIKVLLYLLRCSGRSVSAEEISLAAGVSIQQAEDAVLFWQQANVLTTDMAVPQQSSIMTAPTESAPQEQPVQQTAAPAVIEHQPARQKQNLTPSEISEIIKGSSDIAELVKAAECTMGNLNYTMQNSLIWMHNYLGLKKEVILTLLVYCQSIEKTNSAYIEKIAWSWSEKDINTLSIAQEEVERLTNSHNFVSKIMNAFEMKRRPTTKQLEMIEQWRSEGFSVELIHLAYEKTIENIDKLNFDYLNKILLSWKESGYATVADVQNAETDFRRRRKNEQKSDDFDMEKYKFVINNI